MKVSRTRSVTPVSKKKVSKTRASDGPAFVSHLKNEKNELEDVSRVNELGNINPVGSILAVQEVDELDDGQQKGRRKLRKHGEDILNQLDEIKKDLLIGGIPKERLANLAQSLRIKKQETDDPVLISIINDIELRASVELAKYTRNI